LKNISRNKFNDIKGGFIVNTDFSLIGGGTYKKADISADLITRLGSNDEKNYYIDLIDIDCYVIESSSAYINYYSFILQFISLYISNLQFIFSCYKSDTKTTTEYELKNMLFFYDLTVASDQIIPPKVEEYNGGYLIPFNENNKYEYTYNREQKSYINNNKYVYTNNINVVQYITSTVGFPVNYNMKLAYTNINFSNSTFEINTGSKTTNISELHNLILIRSE
jgi:hypothetical protein